MTSTVKYIGDLRTECTHLKSGQVIITDAPVDNKGKGSAFSPTDLTATSLASCILTTMGIAGEARGIDITGASATVNKIMGDNPRRISKIEIVITMPSMNYSDDEKNILERIAHACPVGRSLHTDLEESVEIIW
jgi:uncharacterized OsmC-like protein